MRGTLVLFAIFFLGATTYQLFSWQNRIAIDRDGIEAPGALQPSDANAVAFDKLDLMVKTGLETYAINRRYHQVNMLLMSRIWIQYLGFLAGLVMALVGCTFILGKIKTEATNFSAETSAMGKFTLISTSPGLILALFGTLVILFTLKFNPQITVNDDSIYLDKKIDLRQAGSGASPDPLMEQAMGSIDSTSIVERNSGSVLSPPPMQDLN